MARKKLTTVVADEIKKRIEDGVLSPGDKLPTEIELCEEFDVSRTVIREAIARLRSEELLISQQGRGVFVSDNPPAQKFEIDPSSLSNLPETIALLELRLSVEVEAASLCAQRRDDEEAKTLRELMEVVDSNFQDPGNVTVHYDYDFHLAIAKGAKNVYFHQFLSFLKPIIVPRFQLSHLVAAELKDEYYETIHTEHEAIVSAIEKQDSVAARQAMRDHLTNSLERLRKFSLSVGLKPEVGKLKGDEQSLINQLIKAAEKSRAG